MLGRFQPDETGHASGHSIPAVRKEPFTVAESTKAATINCGDSKLSQHAPGYPIKVEQPSVTVFPEINYVFLCKGLSDIFADLVNFRADGWPEPSHDFSWRFVHLPHGGL